MNLWKSLVMRWVDEIDEIRNSKRNLNQKVSRESNVFNYMFILNPFLCE